MDLALSGQRVAIFGAWQGIGRAIADAFRAEGCQLRLFDRDEQILTLADGDDCIPIVGDLSSGADIETARKAFGPVDHLVIAAGIGSGKTGFPFWKLEPEDWERVLDVNLTGVVRVAHAFAPALAEQESGTMLFLTSVAGQVGSQTDPPYSAAKAGVINFMQCAAKDLAPHGVRVNCLSPGMVRTELNRSVWAASGVEEDYETWAVEKIGRVSPLGRWQEPAEFGAMAVFLASEHASSITGQTLNIDGGQVMHA